MPNDHKKRKKETFKYLKKFLNAFGWLSAARAAVRQSAEWVFRPDPVSPHYFSFWVIFNQRPNSKPIPQGIQPEVHFINFSHLTTAIPFSLRHS